MKVNQAPTSRVNKSWPSCKISSDAKVQLRRGKKVGLAGREPACLHLARPGVDLLGLAILSISEVGWYGGSRTGS